MHFFRQNLSALSLSNSSLVSKLADVKEVNDFEIFMDGSELSSLNMVHKRYFVPLYENSPFEAVHQSFLEYDRFKKYPYLYFYGLGNGVLIKQLLAEPLRRCIVVIEPELEILYVVLHMIDFSQEITQQKLIILGADDITFPTMALLLAPYDVQKFAKVYDLHINTTYYEKYHEVLMHQTNRLMLEAFYQNINLAGNDVMDALIGLKHHIINLPDVIKTPPLFELVQKLNTTQTAILVSTGPSLTKQLLWLKEIAPYVRIVSVDASFPILYAAGIKPDVVVSIERIPQSAKFFQLPVDAFDDVIFVLSSVQHKEVIESIKGGTKIISLRPHLYMMYTGPKEWGYIGIGQSAANMAYELIYHTNFKNCILIGQDLAYAEDGISHALGHVFGKENVKPEDTDVWVKGWGGNGMVRTNHTWDIFRKSFEKDIFGTKEKMQTINATEGGASIFGAIEISFQDAIKRYVDQSRQKSSIQLNRVVKKEIVRLDKEINYAIETIVAYVKALLRQVEQLLGDLSCIENFQTLSMDEVHLLLSRIEQIKAKQSEVIFEQVIWHIGQSILLSQEISLAPLEVLNTSNQLEEETRLRMFVEQHKAWLFALQNIMEAIVKVVVYAQAKSFLDKFEKIDVYAGNQYIDSFTCNDFKANIGKVFDVDMQGVLYLAPMEYRTKEIMFRDSQTKNVLPSSLVSVLSPDDEKYNEFSFIASLEEEMNEERFQCIHVSDAIGFMATEKNLEDKEFIYFIKLLKEKNYGVPFIVFYFDTFQLQKGLEVFGEDVKYIIPKSVEDIIGNVSIYLYSHLSRETSFGTDRKTREKLLQDAQKIFVIDLKKKIEAGVFAESIALLNAEKKIHFSESIISKVLKGHEKFNEYRFLNSLAFVDEAKVKDLYCPNAIGFLATEENLSDEEFVGYIKELMERFPEVRFKGFCFNKNKSIIEHSLIVEYDIQILILDNINNLLKEIEVFLLNFNIFNFVEKIITPLIKKNKNIFISFFTFSHKNITIADWEKTNQESLNKIIQNVNISEVYKIDENGFFQFVNQQAKLFKEVNYIPISNADIFFNFFNIKLLEYVISCKEFKKFYNAVLVKNSQQIRGNVNVKENF